MQKEVDNEENFLSTFKVHPKYREFQIKADDITKDIQSLSNKNLMLHRKLSRYEESINSEKEPDSSSLIDLYDEAGLHFGDSLIKTLEETNPQMLKHYWKSVLWSPSYFAGSCACGSAPIERVKHYIEQQNTPY